MKLRLHQGETGFILVITIMFLLVASLLVIGILNISCLESRTVTFYQDKVRSFYQAENLLLDAENKLVAGLEVKGLRLSMQKFAE